jgi:hypothetical protein
VRTRLGLAGAALCCLLLSGCAARGANLGTTSDPCFRALPVAASAVEHDGRFIGVRLVAASRLRRRLPSVASLGNQKICLVGFEGHFDSTDVQEPLNDNKGTYAVVAVKTDGSAVLGTAVIDRLPLAFRHTI